MQIQFGADELRPLIREVVAEVLAEVNGNGDDDGDRCLDEGAAAEWLGLPKATLKAIRLEGRVPYVQVSERRIHYRVRDLRQFSQERLAGGNGHATVL